MFSTQYWKPFEQQLKLHSNWSKYYHVNSQNIFIRCYLLYRSLFNIWQQQLFLKQHFNDFVSPWLKTELDNFFESISPHIVRFYEAPSTIKKPEIDDNSTIKRRTECKFFTVRFRIEIWIIFIQWPLKKYEKIIKRKIAVEEKPAKIIKQGIWYEVSNLIWVNAGNRRVDKMSGSSGGSIELGGPISGLKRCEGGMSSPSLSAEGIASVANAGFPRTLSASALRLRPTRRTLFWEQCFEAPPKRDL